MKYLSSLTPEQRERANEAARFIVVGVLATLLQYAIYWLLLHLYHPDGEPKTQQLWASVAMTVGYVVSFVFNFLASTRYTFRVKANAKRGAGFVFSHVVNYLLQMVTLNFFLYVGVPKQWAPIPMFCICVPVNFLLVRFFLKR